MFVNAPLDEIARVSERVGLTLVQLHGDEGPAFCAEVAPAHRRADDQGGAGAGHVHVRDLERFHTAFHLLDGHVAGSARRHRRALRLVARRAARRSRMPLIVGGGLDAEQRRARRSRRPGRSRSTSRAASSRAPGIKDPDRLRAFLDAAPRGAGVSAVAHRYGPYGGQYVPETLMPALAELERPGSRPGPTRRSAPSSPGCCATSPAARRRSIEARAALRERAGRPIWLKREDLNHTGSHKLNNALGQALLAKRMGKPRDHRRDRRRPARRRLGHGVRAARPRVRRLHGGGGHPPPAAQRPAHAAARRARRARRRRRADAEGGDLGGDPRLGRERRHDPLHHRQRRRPGALPGDRARAAARRSATRRARSCSSAPGRLPVARDRLRRRRLELDRDLRRVPRRRGRRADRRRGGRRGHRDRAPRRAADRRRAGRACCTARCRRCSPTTTARSSRRTRSRPASTTRARGPSTRSCATAAARATSPSPTTTALDAFGELARLEGIIPALESSHAIAWALANPGGDARPDLPLRPRRQGSRRGARAAAAAMSGRGSSGSRRRSPARGRARRADALPDGRLSRPRRPRGGSARPAPRRAPTCSSWASRSPIRSPTGR